MDTAITKEMYKEMGIDGKVYSFGQEIAESLKQRFEEIDRVAEYNQLKVVHAMQQCRASEACLYASSGYGYNDVGRDTLEEIYAATFHTESALVRPQIACGTHALAVALAGNLRPGDELLSPVGKPYDTLEEVIMPNGVAGLFCPTCFNAKADMCDECGDFFVKEDNSNGLCVYCREKEDFKKVSYYHR